MTPARTGSRRWPNWGVLLLLGAMVLGVILLAISATSIHIRTQALRFETESTIVPARMAAQDLIIAMALEIEALYTYAYSRNPAALIEYERHVAARRFAMERFTPLVSELDGIPARRAVTLLRFVEVWDSASDGVLASARLGDADRLIPFDLDALFRQTLIEATAVQRALSEDNERARSEIDAAEQLDWLLMLGLVVLSLVASGVIAVLVRRIYRLAEVSERRRLEAEAVMEDRARLARGITHDVKNPLGVADGSAQLLEMGVVGELTDQQLEIVRRIRRGIGDALGIISDLIDLSRAHGGGLVLDLEPMDMAAAIRDVVEKYRHQAEGKAITLELHLPDRPEPVITDERKVREIVANLLSNAIKYTPSGGNVAVRMERQAGGLGAREIVCVAVSDSGPGIPIDEQALVFEEYYRAISAVGRAPGVGLGLAISRRMARLLGGDVTLESVPGAGSTFTLCLPTHAAGGLRRAA